MLRSIILLSFMALSISSQEARSQQLAPLDQLIADGAEDTYPLVRCAAFYLSMLEWMGEDKAGPETSNKIKLAVYNLISNAAQIRSDNGAGDVDYQQSIAMRDVRNISDVYLDRYKNNYAVQGQAWGKDDLWKADQAICAILMGSSEK